MIEVIKLENITSDVLHEVAKEILKGEPKKEQEFKIKETLHKAPTLEEKKEDLEKYKKVMETLVKEIKEEEARRKKETHHLIEKKVRRTQILDEVLCGTYKKDYQTQPKHMISEETMKYVREGNKIICTITTPAGTFKGESIRHSEDEFKYEDGMTLAMLRARRSMYAKMESDLVSAM